MKPELHRAQWQNRNIRPWLRTHRTCRSAFGHDFDPGYRKGDGVVFIVAVVAFLVAMWVMG